MNMHVRTSRYLYDLEGLSERRVRCRADSRFDALGYVCGGSEVVAPGMKLSTLRLRRRSSSASCSGVTGLKISWIVRCTAPRMKNVGITRVPKNMSRSHMVNVRLLGSE